MSNYIFLFDLDSTITRQEILSTIAKKSGDLWENECLNWKHYAWWNSIQARSFTKSRTPVSEIQDIVCNIELNDKLVRFIEKNKDRSYIGTGNLDVWIEKLINKLSMEKSIFCSKAIMMLRWLMLQKLESDMAVCRPVYENPVLML